MNETNNTPELVQNTVDSVDIDNASTVLNPGIDKKIDSENPKENEDINSPLESETQPKTVRIPLTIRCPFTTTDLNIYIDPSSTVAHLKRKICKEFPSNPKPSDQRLIFGGRIILNNEILSDVLKRQMCDLSTPPTIHLIINSLALQNAKSAKQPSNHTNSENVSAVTSPSSNTQVSSEELKQNLNESSASDSNLASPNVINSDVKETEAQSAPTEANPTNIPIATPEANVMNLKVTEPSTSTASEVNTDLSTDKTTTTATVNSDAIQYVLINNIIYAVQVAPSLTIPINNQPSLMTSNDIDNNTINREENNANGDNNNNNNNDQAEAENAQQNVINQILNDNDQQQRQQPNQFFLLVRLAFIVYLLTQGGGYIRMCIVSLIAIIIFLVQTGRIRVTVINYRNLQGNGNGLNANQNNGNNNNNNNDNNNNNNDNNNNNNNNENNNRNIENEIGENEPLLNNENNNENNNNNNNNNPENEVRQYTLFQNCRRVFFAFFLSLIPFIQDIA